jgi:hypothetical protein
MYPAIYKGRDRVPWNYQTPFLTCAQDFPALSMGYHLPSYRLAIEVTQEMDSIEPGKILYLLTPPIFMSADFKSVPLSAIR